MKQITDFDIKESILNKEKYMLYEVDSDGNWVIKGILDWEKARSFKEEIRSSCNMFLNNGPVTVNDAKEANFWKSTYILIPCKEDIFQFERIPVLKDIKIEEVAKTEGDINEF